MSWKQNRRPFLLSIPAMITAVPVYHVKKKQGLFTTWIARHHRFLGTFLLFFFFFSSEGYCGYFPGERRASEDIYHSVSHYSILQASFLFEVIFFFKLLQSLIPLSWICDRLVRDSFKLNKNLILISWVQFYESSD